MDVLLAALAVQVLAGFAAFAVSKSPRAATVLGAGGAVAGCVLGLVPALRVLLGGGTESLRLAWDAAHGAFWVEVDPLSAFFLVPVLGLSALAAVYGADYLRAYRHEKSLGAPWLFFNVFVASMVLVVIARTSFLFLVAWEIMSVAAYFLVTFEHERDEVRRAGWVYLIASHLGVTFLFLAFLLLGRHARSLEFAAFSAAGLGAGGASLILVLALIGFGAKAGLVPLHVWLPEAHPAAPSHVSALMSGVMIKMGLYGLLRVLTFLGPPLPWWGPLLAGLGLLTGLVGISLALHQRDVKRALAYSSIENMGLIALALGVGLWGGASGLATVAVLGVTAALLHTWNHALMKGLMFFAAGSILHGTGTRDMEKLGGLMKRMPWTGCAMIVGAVALAALPPLNGFVSKWLLYLGLLQDGLASSGSRCLTVLLSVGLLALIGGLSAVAFVRLTGIVLLGSPRSEAAEEAHESSPWLLGPMLVLVVLCLSVALAPQATTGLLTRTLNQVIGGDAGSTLLGLESRESPLYLLGNVNAWTMLCLAGGALVFMALSRRARWTAGPTWGCGYVQPTPRIQYTGRSFSELLAEHLLPRLLRPRTTRHAPHGLFPAKSDFRSECPDPISEKVYEPFFHGWAERFARLRILQQGKVNVYLIYIALMVVVAFAWISVRPVVDAVMSEALVLLGIGIAAVSGLPGLLWGRTALGGQFVTTLLAVVGSGLGLAGVGCFWITGASQPIDWPWSLPGAEFSVALDGLSAFFLVPVFLIALLGNVYGLGYWKQTDHPQNGRKLRVFYGTLTAGMALLVIARNSILFLFGWEIMALSAFFLVTTEDHDPEVRAAGWIYLGATHLATLCLFALFALLRAQSDSFALVPLKPDSLSPGMATAIFLLALAGFGVKAGLMPLHVWLPGAHASAPSHVSAIMSGVLIKMGIYGLVRVTALLPHPPLEWGTTLLVLGAVSGVLGVAFAIGQHDLKRLLAYHSIENIGIIVMGLGLALLGRTLGQADWIVLGLSGALLHVWNHALFKALLFLSAGSVVHATGQREIDRLGGLAKAMPWTSAAFMVGAVAICGLPPLNGFVSEFLIYLGLFGTLGSADEPSFAGAALAAPALALIGALAVACFVKVYGIVFLGTPRSVYAQHAHEAGASMLGPMGVLVASCILIGLAPVLLTPLLVRGVSAWAPGLTDTSARLATLAPLGWITTMGLLLLGALFLVSIGLWAQLRRSVVVPGATWGCGYVAPTPRIQYTSSSFAQVLVGLFAWALRPRTHAPEVRALFPRKTDFHSEVPDPVLDEAVLPAFGFGAWVFSWLRVFQQGNIQAYLLYIFLALIALLLWR